MKGQNDESAELKWEMWLELQSSLDNGRYNECLLLFRPAYFMLLSTKVIISVNFGAIKDLSFSLFVNAFMYWKRSLVGEKIYPESIIYCWSLIILLRKYSSCSLLLKTGVDISD